MTNRWPLVEKRMTRAACITWLGRNGLDLPPKSACVFCPYHSTATWRQTKAVPEDWEKALKVDELIRDYAPPYSHYLTNKLMPIEDLDLSTEEDRGQMSFFDCSGTCWM